MILKIVRGGLFGTNYTVFVNYFDVEIPAFQACGKPVSLEVRARASIPLLCPTYISLRLLTLL